MTDVLSVLYRDEHYIAVDKPAGLLVHRSRVDRSATRFALQMVRDQAGQHVYPVHRLDKPTSGVLVFALHPEAARRLSDAFAGRQVRKVYLAVVRGFVGDEDVIDYPLKEKLDKTTDGLADPDKPAQTAVTAYRRLGQVELDYAVSRYPTSRYSLVEAHPRTGRKHQLRRHFKHIFHPIIGDGKYGDYRHNRFFRMQLGCARMLLAAVELSFLHPYTGVPIEVKAGPGGAFLEVLTRLGLTPTYGGVTR
jgi:tRNA pseudouridine65 synthase